MYDIDELYRDRPDAELEVSAADEKLLKECRERFDYALEYWHDAREQRRLDMKYVCGDPWDEKERKAREDAHRPVLHMDEITQYINQSINNIRQNQRGIVVEPAGSGANEKTAEYRQARIRGIEYRCKATETYETAYQQMLEGSYGFYRISRKWTSKNPDNWEQDIVISSIPNPDSVLYDPDCKEPDWADAKWAFILEPMSREQFRRQWPNAKATDYNSHDHTVAPRWVSERTVLVCEYWRVDVDVEKQRRISPRTGKPQTRNVERKRVTQYFTNGLEILEKNEQPGEEIPIPSCIGLERYLPAGDGTQASRIIFSLVRFSRDPQMFYDYLSSQEAELAGLVPKSPYVGYVGQFESQRKAWETCTKIPYAFLEADPIPDSSNGQILPLPQREAFSVDFSSWEVAKESCRRAIQSAMGISPLPTAAQRYNQKSGLALDKIQEEQALGSYHFVSNFERAIARGARIIESWLAEYDEGERDVSLAFGDKRKVVRINRPPMVDPSTGQVQPYLNPQTGAPEPDYQVVEGEHDVTVSAGPSSQSQRDGAEQVLKGLIANMQNLPLAPPQGAQLLAKAIQMLGLGPDGDEMAQIIAPDQQQEIPPAAQAAMSQAQTQLQQLQQYAQQLEGQVQQLTYEKQARVVDNQAKLETEQLKAETQIAVAQIQTKAQEQSQRLEAIHELLKDLHKSGHERSMQASEHAHDLRMHDEDRNASAEMAAIDRQTASEQAAEDRAAKLEQLREDRETKLQVEHSKPKPKPAKET